MWKKITSVKNFVKRKNMYLVCVYITIMDILLYYIFYIYYIIIYRHHYIEVI